MTPEVVLTRMLPAVETLLKAIVARAVAPGTPPTLYELEDLLHVVLPQIGQVVLGGTDDSAGPWPGGPAAALCVWGGADLP
jgi:hypothetical protein